MNIENDETDVLQVLENSNSNFDKANAKSTSGPVLGWGVWRFVIAILGFLAMTNSYTIRSHLSVTIVAMVGSSNSTNISNECGSSEEQTTPTNGEFDWDQQLEGIINGAFYYGYIVPQILGGRLAENYGAKWVVFFGGCIATVATLIGPIAARTSVAFFIVTRVICGLGLSVFQPCLHSLIARWAPPNERSIFSAIVYSGNQFGVVIAMPIAGVLCSLESDGGWPWSFYVFGMVSVVWLVLWFIFVYNTPDDHPWISEKEKNYIKARLSNTSNQEHKLPVPWKEIFLSKPVWGLIVCHTGYNWGFYTLLTELPTYMNDVLGFSLSENGIFSSLPYLIMMVVGYVSSFAAYQVIKRNLLPVRIIRKGLNTTALYGSALALLTITLLTCKTMQIYGMLMLAVIFCGLTYAGFQLNHVDLSPNFAGTLQGITNTFATISGIVAPYVVGVITNGNETQAAWNVVFYIAMAIVIASGTIYLILGSGDLQPWNDPEFKTTKHKLENGVDISLSTSSRGSGKNKQLTDSLKN